MRRHSISAYHDNGSLIWTWRLTLTFAGAGLLLEGVTAVLWAVGVRVGASVLPAAFGVVALFAAISGRIGSAIKLRYAEERLPAVPAFVPGLSGLRPRRRVVRRWSGFAWLMMAIIVCLPVSILTDWNAEPTGAQVGEMTGSILLIAACWLLGPAARFVITREHLHIDTGFRRTSLPRKLLAGFLGGGLGVPGRVHQRRLPGLPGRHAAARPAREQVPQQRALPVPDDRSDRPGAGRGAAARHRPARGGHPSAVGADHARGRCGAGNGRRHYAAGLATTGAGFRTVRPRRTGRCCAPWSARCCPAAGVAVHTEVVGHLVELVGSDNR